MHARMHMSLHTAAHALCINIHASLLLRFLLAAQVSGLPPRKGTPVMVFMAGWPDDHGTWSAVAPRFAKSHTIITLCMPDYDKPKPTRWWGWKFGEIASMLDDTLGALVPEGQVRRTDIHSP